MKTCSTLSFLLALFIYAILAVVGYLLWQQPATEKEDKVRPIPVALSMFAAPKPEPVESIKPIEAEPIVETKIMPEPAPEPLPIKPEPKKVEKPVVKPVKKQVVPPVKPVEKPKPKPKPQPIKQPPAKKEVKIEPQPVKQTVAPKETEQSATVAEVKHIDTPKKPAFSPQQKADAEQAYLYELRQRIVRYAQDTYPKRAKRRRWQGEVMVGFTILKNGQITGIKILETSGRNILDRAALEIFQINMNGQFKPIPQESGRSIWKITIPVTYNLNSY